VDRYDFDTTQLTGTDRDSWEQRRVSNESPSSGLRIAIQCVQGTAGDQTSGALVKLVADLNATDKKTGKGLKLHQELK